MKSLDCLRPRGMMVTFWNASDPGRRHRAPHPLPEGLPLPDPSLCSPVTAPPPPGKNCNGRAGRFLGAWVNEGKLKLHIFRNYPLSDAAQAQRDLESRQTSGKLVLHP